MKSLFACICILLLLAPITLLAATPIPDVFPEIQINGTDNYVVVPDLTNAQSLSLEVMWQPDSDSRKSWEIWLYAHDADGYKYFNPKSWSWVPGLIPSYNTKKISTLPTNLPLNGINFSKGTVEFYAVTDKKNDKKISNGQYFSASVVVIISTNLKPTCINFSYGPWSECQFNTQLRDILESFPEGCIGGNPVTEQSCAPPPSICTTLECYTWGTCQASGTQTCTSYKLLPDGCQGGNVSLVRSCTPICTECSYTDWTTCQPEGLKYRNLISMYPPNCTGCLPQESMACTPASPTCTTFTYSDYGSCQPDNKQYRTIISSLPAGCVGGNPILSQACNYISVMYQTYGLDFSPYIGNQNPDYGSIVPEQQLRDRLQIVKPYTVWVRFFGSTLGLENAARIAKEMGFKVAASAWIGKDAAANDKEIANLIAAAKAGYVDIAIVGSEVLLRGDDSESHLIGYINQVKQAAPGVQVSYGDVYGEYLSHPNIINAVDFLFVNFYSYWEGGSIDKSICFVDTRYKQLKAISQGKPIKISEVGWPSCGNTIGEAVPSPANAAYHFQAFVSWARANNVDYFYFEAFDESWKVINEGPQGACWGVFDKDGVMKPGMEKVFNNETIPISCTQTSACSATDPILRFTFVPQINTTDNLKGQVCQINSAGYEIAVYIKVGSGWWTKPTWANPLTFINSDGSWICDITTGGIDSTANEIAAFLVPNGYTPPQMSGGNTLPAELYSNAIAHVEQERNP
jgi:exo-beta-1,3-glucanase (GH17 family)